VSSAGEVLEGSCRLSGDSEGSLLMVLFSRFPVRKENRPTEKVGILPNCPGLVSRRTAGQPRKWNLKTIADLARLAHVFEPIGRCAAQHDVHRLCILCKYVTIAT
jgi:hypothetical protein